MVLLATPNNERDRHLQVLATLARSMPQFGLLFILVALPMNLLSGGNTPIESQPEALQLLMQAA